MTVVLMSAPLRVDRLKSGKRRLVRDLKIDLGIELNISDAHEPYFTTIDGTTRVMVPRCFVTDFSSIPPAARFLYRFSKVDLAGCCHDLAYRIGVNRAAADQVWRLVATSGRARVGALRGWLGWAGLRAGGWMAYHPTGDPFVVHGDASGTRDSKECLDGS